MEELYRRALYRVEGDVVFVLRVGQYSATLCDLFIDTGHQSAAFLTAYNPAGVKISDAENRLAQKRLVSDLRLRGLPTVQATGLDSDPDSDWPGEPSEFVLGISKYDAVRLGVQFRQLAIVWCAATAVPELLMLEQLEPR